MVLTQKKGWAKIENLFPEQIATLSELGYPTYQMRSILEDFLRGRKPSQLTKEDVTRIQSELDKYIEFARNCYKSTCE